MSTQQEHTDDSAVTPLEEDQQDAKVLQVDGNRPIDASKLEIQKVLPIDGNRPVVAELMATVRLQPIH
ncbi:MAG: hypothetical protein C4287_16135 [Leptolyngbya sp. ERB_1_2]